MKGFVMRITIVLGPFKPPPPAPSGAVEKAWWSLAKAFVAAGHAVTVVGPDHPDLPRGEGWDGIAYRRLPLLGRSGRTSLDVIRDFGWSRKAKAALPEADVTVTNCVWLPSLLGRRGSATRGPLGVLEVHVQRFPKGQMRLYRHADSISTVSAAISEAISRERPELAARIRVVPNPVDLTVFRTTEECEARRESSPPAVLLYTGRIHPEKRLDLLVEAWRRMIEEGASLRLRLVGPWETAAGGGGRALVERLEALAEPHEFELPGPLADPAALAAELRGADLYCYPSTAAKGEALPVAPLEAMACGLAPIVADLPQYAGILERGVNASVFDGSLEGLCSALREVLSDPSRRRALDRRAAIEANSLSVESIASRHLSEWAS
jgi:glycosyltransferase involved in cell wall biosynthesis